MTHKELTDTLYGTSKSRNPKIQNMLRMIGYGENLGSGFPKIISAWKQAGWKEPLLENRIDLDEVRLTLYVPFEVSDESGQTGGQTTIDTVLQLIVTNPKITRKQLMEKTGKASNTIQKAITSLKEDNRIRRVGGDFGGYWEIIDKDGH